MLTVLGWLLAHLLSAPSKVFREIREPGDREIGLGENVAPLQTLSARVAALVAHVDQSEQTVPLQLSLVEFTKWVVLVVMRCQQRREQESLERSISTLRC